MARETIERSIVFNKEDVLWFSEQFPRASLSGICSMLLEKFREVNEHTPQYYAELAARTLSEDINSKRGNNDT